MQREQFLFQSDVYSLGLLLGEMLKTNASTANNQEPATPIYHQDELTKEVYYMCFILAMLGIY